MHMFPFLYLQVKYKEAIGQGTPIPDLPEVKRVKETQKHISSVVAHTLSMRLCSQHPCLLPGSALPLLPLPGASCALGVA